MADFPGEADLRSQEWEKDVKGFALQEYRMKELCMVVPTSAWTNSYYQETAADLTATGTRTVKKLGRFSEFPSALVSEALKSAIIEKYGLEAEISWEDAKFNIIDVIARHNLRLGRAVAKAVDDVIWAAISGGPIAAPALINYVTIAAGSEWDSATVANRDPIQDILNAKKEIAIDNFDPERNGYLLVSPKGYADLLGNDKVSRNSSFKAADVVANGKVANLLGLQIIVSNSVTADYAMVCVAKECATWKTADPLSVLTKVDEGIKYTLRAFEYGVCQVTSPLAICLIVNTEK